MIVMVKLAFKFSLNLFSSLLSSSLLYFVLFIIYHVLLWPRYIPVYPVILNALPKDATSEHADLSPH